MIIFLEELFADPLWGLDIFISNGYKHTFMNNVHISLYQADIFLVLLQFIALIVLYRQLVDSYRLPVLDSTLLTDPSLCVITL